MVGQFNETFKPDDINKVAALPEPKAIQLWVGLVAEELQELHDAYESDDIVEYFDAICDVLYVFAQQAHLHGFPIEEGLREVHRSNMSKLDEDGNPIIREDGKVLKGKGFTPPNLKAILDKQRDKSE